MTGWMVLAYLALVFAVGLAGGRAQSATRDQYFVAGRRIGPFVLLMTLFGTNMTAFSLLGASDEAYEEGIAVFAWMGSGSALLIPFLTLLLGTQAWVEGRRTGCLTQTEFLRRRYDSESVGLLVFGASTVFLFPYVMIGIKGAGLAVSALTSGAVPALAGSGGLCGVIALYVVAGGMRGTSWVNTLQAGAFVTLSGVACVLIAADQGGLAEAFRAVEARHPELLRIGGDHAFARFLSFALLPLSVAGFPHMFGHWLTARSVDSFRLAVVAYPVCVALVWVPSVLMGLLARVGLSAEPRGPVLLALVDGLPSELVGGLLAIAILAAIMSSLDSQVLTLANLLSNDLLGRLPGFRRAGERRRVWTARILVVAILGAAWFAADRSPASLFQLGIWSLSGFAGLAPAVIASLHWSRSTPAGVVASLLVALAMWSMFLIDAGGARDYSLVGGLLPVCGIVGNATAALVVVSWLTTPRGPLASPATDAKATLPGPTLNHSRKEESCSLRSTG